MDLNSIYIINLEVLGLGFTSDMINAINRLPEMVEKYREFKFTKKELPFLFAEQRAMQAPTLKIGGSSFDKDNYLKENVKLKFISYVIENNSSLKNILEARKTTDKKASKSLNQFGAKNAHPG